MKIKKQQRIEEMNEKEQKDKNADEILEIKKILNYNKDAQNLFYHASKIDKENQNQRLKKVLQKGRN